MAEVTVEFSGVPVYARRRAEAHVDFDGVIGFYGNGETHEDARKDLLAEVEKHALKVQVALDAIRNATAPDIPVLR